MKSTPVRVIIFCCQLLVLTVLAASPAISAQDDAASTDAISGTILETMDAAGYTYLSIDTDGGHVWVAIPQSSVNKGQKISVIKGMEMKNFHSKSFDRTFPSIIFSPGIAGETTSDPQQKLTMTESPPAGDSFAAAVAEERRTSAAPLQPEQTSGGSMGAVAPFTEVDVAKAEGANSYRIEELFNKAKELDGKKVRVRGQVVKYSPNIMGRNWLHLQDGSGDPMQNTHDLVVTTKEELQSPQIVTIEGILAADKDFGAGYKYQVIIENSTIIK